MELKIYKKTVLVFLITFFALFQVSPFLLQANTSRDDHEHFTLWFSSPVKEQNTSMTLHYDFEKDVEISCFYLHILFPKDTFLFDDDNTSFMHTDFLPYLRINGNQIDETDSIGRLTRNYFTLSNYAHLYNQSYLQITLTDEFGLLFKDSGLIPFEITLGIAYINDTGEQKIDFIAPCQVRVFEYLP